MSTAAAESRTALVEDLMERFPHVPREAVFKEDLLRGGVAFDASALSDNDGEVKPKSYFIFSFDHGTLPELGEAALRRPPEEIILTGGPYDLRRTVVSVRVNPSSPYRWPPTTRVLGLYLDGERIADVGVPPMPEYYRHTLANGKSVMEVAPTIQWGYLIYLTVSGVCQYFGAKEECQYCDINHNWRQHKAAGRPYTGVKDVEEVLEALEIIDRYDTAKASTAYTLTGGAITSKVEGRDEADFYGRYAKAIEERFPGRWIGKVVAQALPQGRRAALQGLRRADLPPQLRGVGPAAVRAVLPRQGALRRPRRVAPRILDSAEVFGARNVIPNFVAGVEMASPSASRRSTRPSPRRPRACASSCRTASRPASPPGAPSRRPRSARPTRRARRWSTTSGCWRRTAPRWRSFGLTRRPATASPARATRSSR